MLIVTLLSQFLLLSSKAEAGLPLTLPNTALKNPEEDGESTLDNNQSVSGVSRCCSHLTMLCYLHGNLRSRVSTAHLPRFFSPTQPCRQKKVHIL